MRKMDEGGTIIKHGSLNELCGLRSAKLIFSVAICWWMAGEVIDRRWIYCDGQVEFLRRMIYGQLNWI